MLLVKPLVGVFLDDLNLTRQKRRKFSPVDKTNYFDELPDELIVLILSKLSSSAERPADVLSIQATCRRMKELGLDRLVLREASSNTLALRASNWCDSAHRFLKLCAESGNVEASYLLGMIQFYCLRSRRSGVTLMAKAAINSHAPALYSLAVIQFNGSGGTKADKDLRAGVALCARAAYLNHVDALCEFGHCLQDGYGVCRNVSEGRKFLVKANALELAAVNNQPVSDFGCDLPPLDPHPANRFLTEWFTARGGACGGDGLRMCSQEWCGRPETRKHEFRRCSVCGLVNYCSRACQALDWKLRHKAECVPLERRIEEGGDGDVADGVNDALDEEG